MKDLLRRLLSLTLAVVMTVQLLPLQVFAEDTLVIDDPQQIEQLVGGEAATEEEGGEEIPLAPLLPQQPLPVTKTAVYTVKFDLHGAGEDSFALLKKFIAQQKGEIVGTQSEAGRENLSAIEQKFYDYLRASVTTLAASATGGSSVFNTDEYLGYAGLKTSWTNTELGVDSIEKENYDQIGTLFGQQFDFSKIIDALLHDLPLECYWIDKTSQMYYQIYMTFTGYQDENGNVTLTEVTVSSVDFAFPVTVAYAENGDVYRLSSSLYRKYTDCDSQMAAAASNTASFSDTYSKLTYLKDFICGKTQYNHDAADSGNFTADATPWQIIGVFYDENGVVCEGYSKTFQQLCDKLHMLGVEDFECYTVTGVMAGGTGAGPHMWNIVTMDDGKTYIADVTNSDQGSVGQNGGMFIAPATGSVAGGYTVNVNGTEILYTYSAETLGLLPQSVLTISDTEYTVGSTERQKYTVTFETGVDGMTVEPLTVEEYGYISQLPNLPRLGYRLIGWSLSPEMHIFWTTETDRVDENLTLYAVWEKLITTDTDLPQEGETHTVTFVPTLGDRTYYYTVEVETGAKLENQHPWTEYITENSADYSVLEFFGEVYKDARCTQPWDFEKDTVTEDITLYEKWHPKFRVIWMMDEYSSTWATYHPGTKLTFTDMAGQRGSREGYAIAGWYYDQELTQPVERDAVAVLDKDIVLYPDWQEGCQVAIRYSKINEDGYYEDFLYGLFAVKKGEKILYPAIEVPDGYVMDETRWYYYGWDENDNYINGYWDFENDVVNGEVNIDNTMRKVVTVTFDTQGRGTAPASVQFPLGYYPYQLPQGEADGYCLMGWYYDPECTRPVTVEYDWFDGDVTVFAKWGKHVATDTDLPQEGETHTVTFVPTLGDRTYYSPMEIENGGKIENDHPYDSYDVDISLGGSVLVFEGQLYKDARCTQPWDYDKDTVTSDITLYEKWNPKFQLKSMSYYGGYSTSTYDPGEIVTYNDLYWSPGPDGIAISGWYLDAELTDKIEKDDVIVMDKDVTIYPKFENGYQVVIKYSIEKDDGSFEYLTHDVLVLQAGDKIPEPEIEVPDGYKWSSGWNYEGDDYTFTLWDFENDVVTDDVYLYNKLIKSTADINWSFDETTGTLTITGTGAIPYYYMDLRPEWEIYKDDITKVVIGEGITTIGGHAFYNYKNITSLEIPENAAISFGAFGFCYGLADENGFVIINNVLCAYNGSDETVVIPDSVNRIAEYVFSSKTAIKSVEIPAGISAIGSYAFFGCEALEDIYFGGTEEQWNNVVVSSYNDALDNVTVHFADEIPGGPCGNYSFWKVEDGVLTIYGEGAMFDYKHAYTSDEVANHAPWRDYGYEIETVIIEEGITYIGNDAFCGLAAAKRFVVPSTVVTIGPAAFRGCMSMEELVFAENSSLKTIRTQAFWGIAQIKPGFELRLPEGLETIEAEAFRMYIGNKVYVPASVNNIGSPLCSKYCPDAEIIISEDNEKYSVQNNAIVTYEEEIDGYALISILPVNGEYTVADNIRRIAPKAFAYTDASKVTIPDTVNFIGEGLFIESEDINGNSLKEVVIDSKIEWLMENTFKDCYSLQTVYLPGSLTEIRPGAFENCESLKEIYFDGTEKQWSEIVIGENNDQLNNVTVNFTATTSGTCGENAQWSLENGVLTIYGTGPIEDYGYGANYTPWSSYAEEITVVVVEEGITAIGNGAFFSLSNMKTAQLPDSLVSIGDYAFTFSGIETVEIPKNVSDFDAISFGMSYANSVTVDAENSYFTSENNIVYDINKKTVVYTAPNGVTGDVVLPDTVKYIGQNAFMNTAELSSLTISKGIEEIGAYAFINSGIRIMYLPGSLKTVKENAFSNAENLETVYYGGTESEWDEITIEQGNECFTNAEIIFAGPERHGECGENATWSIIDDTGMLVISGSGAMFDYASGSAPWYQYRKEITSLAIQPGITHIGNGAFYLLSGLTEVVLPESVETIGENAFEWCDGIKTFVMSDTVKSIGKFAFWECSAMDNLVFSKNLEAIGEGAFTHCRGLTEVVVPDSVTSIDYSAFANCKSLIRVTLPDYITEIKDYLFAYCDNLVSVTVPTAIKDIKYKAFYECPSLKHIYYFGSVKQWSEITIGEENEALNNVMIHYGAFDITAADCENGTVAVDKTLVKAGETITITATPAEGYVLKEILVDGVAITGNTFVVGYDNEDGIVNVTAVFERTVFTGICGDNLTWTLADGVLTISGTGPMYDYGHQAAPWYEYNGIITDVVVENGVTSISAYAFNNLYNLERATVGAGVAFIGTHAFSFCDNLEKLVIYSTETITEDAYLVESPKLKTAGPMGSGCNVEFAWTNIPEKGFWGTSLETVTIPEGTNTIGSAAFYNCEYLHTVYMPESVREITYGAFGACAGLTDIYYRGSKGQWGSIANYGNNDPLENANIHYAKADMAGENVTWTVENGTLTISGTGDMADYDFMNGVEPAWYNQLDKITAIVIEDGVTSIGACAFCGLSNVTDVQIASSVTKINNMAFAWCTALEEIVIPEGVNTIGRYVFNSCTNLAKVVIPASVTAMEDSNFTGTPKLKTAGAIGTGYDIEFGWTDKIPANAFCSSDSLVSAVIPDGITAIGTHAFSFCQNLEKLIIPASAVNIEDAFMVGSPNLKTAGPAGSGCNVEFGWDNIYEKAFMSSALEIVTIPAQATEIYAGVFSNCVNLHTVNMSDNIEFIGYGAFDNCVSLQTITIPGSVIFIADGVFNGCDNLSTVYYNGTQEMWNNIYIGAYNDPLVNADIIFNEFVEYTVNFETGVDGLTADPVSVERGGRLYGLPNLVRPGYRLMGWSRYPDYIRYWTVENDRVYENITLYAIWDKVTTTATDLPGMQTMCEIKFNTGVKNLTVPSQHTLVGNGIDFLPNIQREGYRIVGWSKSATSNDFWTWELDKVYNDITLYAVWEKVATTGSDLPGDERFAAGWFGENYYWRLDRTSGLLTINGYEEMDEVQPGKQPWYKYRKDIRAAKLTGYVVNIPANLFADHTNLETVSIPDTVTTMGTGIFAGCTKLHTINYNDTVYLWNTITKPQDIPANVTIQCYDGTATDGLMASGSFGYGLAWEFDKTTAQLTISGSGSMTQLASWPWQGMGNISKVVFTSGIKTVYLSFLDGMDGVTIEIPSTVTKIVVGDAFFTDAQVYYDGTIEKWISIDKTQTTSHGLKSAVVYYVPEMSTMSVELPNVTMFGLNAYFTVSGRTVTIKGKGTIGSGVQTAPWGDAADTVVIESGITEIGTGALADYSAVTNVVIPATVKSIGADALPKSQQAEIYFNGTEKQWNSIKIDSTNEIDQTVDCNTVWGVNSVTVTDSEGNALSQLDIDVYDETVVSAVKVKVDGLGEYSDEIIVATTSDFVATITETDVRGEYLVYTNGEGSAEVTFTSAEKPEIKATVKVKATQMASAVTATISKLTTDDGKYILFAGNTVTPTITWLDGAQWPEYTVSVADGSSDVYADGKLTVAQAGEGVLTITATGAGNRTLTASVPYIVYTEKVKGITASATKLILDHLAGKAEGDITVMPSNDGACPDFDISWTTAANIVVEQTGTNSVHAWALNNEKGSVTVTFKAKDGSGKTFKATVQTGIAVQQMELIPAATNVAIGKSVKVTSYVMPDSATLKTLTWYSEDETVATVKNGTVTGKSAGTTTIWAQTTDGTDIAQSFEITVFNPANTVQFADGIKTINTEMHGMMEEKHLQIPVAVLNKAGTTDGVLQDLDITVTTPKGANVYNVSYDKDTGIIDLYTWQACKHTITAVTKDGTNKKATLTINVEQHVFEFAANPPKNTQNYTQGGLPVWVVKADTTVTPQVVYNGGDKAFAPVKAAAKYTITALEYTPDDATLEDAKCLTFNTAKTNVKAVQTGEYRLSIQLVDICGQCANSFIAQEVILKVIPKTSVDFTNAWVKSSGSYIDSMSALAVPQGVTVTLTPYVGDVKATNITTAWGALEADASNTGTATFSAGKLNLKYAQPGDEYTVTYTLTDKSNPANVFESTKRIIVFRKVLNTDIQLLTDIGGTPVTDPGLNLTMQSDPLMVYVPEVDGALNNYTVTTSSAKILAVEENGFGSWALVPQGTGTATITVAINDGSGVKQTFKVKVNAVDVPVNSINVNNKTLYLESGRPVAVQFMLKSKTGADPSMQNVQWTTSDETKVTVFTPYTDTAEGFIEICPQATGKATITGTAMDGSKKTVKITVNVVEQSKAQYTQGILLTAPVNVATNGTNDTPALVWGKTMQLKATLKPSTAKNKTIAYEVVAKDTGLPVPGVTVKSGKVTVAKPSATLTPYVGTVVVRAYITDYMAANGSGYEWIEDTMEIEIKSPLDKIALTNTDPMYPGETRQLNAELVKNLYATVAEEYPLLWTVSDNKLAEIDENGLLTIKDTAPVGKSVKVTAATQDGSGKKVTVTIKIVKYTPPPPVVPDVPSVILVCTNLGDKSFNDSADAGLQNLEDEGLITYKALEYGTDNSKVPITLEEAAEDYDIVISSNLGYGMCTDWLRRNAADYPDTKFIVYDEPVDIVADIPNVQMLAYKTNEVDFLAGALAALVSETGIIGFLGGMETPVVLDYLVGYIEGAKYVNPDIKVDVAYVGSYTDAAKAKDLGVTALRKGATVFHHIAGSAGNGYLEAAMEAGKIGIGVDADQYEAFKTAKPDLANSIITSSLKNVGKSLEIVIRSMLDGTYQWEQCKWFGVAEGCVGLAENENYYRLAEQQDVDAMELIKQRISSGEIKVSTAYGMDYDEINALVNSVL